MQRDKAEWNQVEFFIEKYSNQKFLQNIDNDLLLDEFVDYQSICDDDISADAWAEAEVVDEKDDNKNKLVHYRIDVLWHYIEKIIAPEHAIKGSNFPCSCTPTAIQAWKNYSVL